MSLKVNAGGFGLDGFGLGAFGHGDPLRRLSTQANGPRLAGPQGSHPLHAPPRRLGFNRATGPWRARSSSIRQQ